MRAENFDLCLQISTWHDSRSAGEPAGFDGCVESMKFNQLGRKHVLTADSGSGNSGDPSC